MWTLQRTWWLVAFVTLGCLILSGATQGQDKKADDKKKLDKNKPEAKPLLTKADELTEDDEKDTHPTLKKSPRKVYKIKLDADKIYQIDLKSKDFDSVLRLEDSAGKEVAINDDYMADSLDARIFYAVAKTGEYKVIATCRDGQPGKFALTVVEAPPGTTPSLFKAKSIELTAKDGKASHAGELNDKDPIVKEHYYKAFTIKMEAGKTYTIDHKSDDFDAYLLFEDPLGNIIAQDDDSGGGLDARIVHKATTTGVYRIIASTFENKETGKFKLTVATGPAPNPAPKKDSRLSLLPSVEFVARIELKRRERGEFVR